jgi:uncharacterized repeat protein (TIGR01451 family)
MRGGKILRVSILPVLALLKSDHNSGENPNPQVSVGIDRGSTWRRHLRALTLPLLAGALMLGNTQPPPSDAVGADGSWLPGAQCAIAEKQYEASRNDEGLQAPNRAHNITVLTYNTHLFEDSAAALFRPGTVHDDTTRRLAIVEKIRELCQDPCNDGCPDIVALQEVWGNRWTFTDPSKLKTYWFSEELKDIYPYSAKSGKLGCRGFLNVPGLSDGVVVLSKWPLTNVTFDQFPCFEYYKAPNTSEYWARKGVLSAIVEIGDYGCGDPAQTVRLAGSHAFTGKRWKTSKMDPAYVPNTIAPFELEGQVYIYYQKSDENRAFITRIDDYSYFDEETGQHKYGAGFKDVLDTSTSRQPDTVRSFEFDGDTYLFTYTKSGGAIIYRVNDDGKSLTEWLWHESAGGAEPQNITMFELKGHPYIFSLGGIFEPKPGRAVISQLDEDGSWREYDAGPWQSNYETVQSFELHGRPYIFGYKNNGRAYYARINDDGKSYTDVGDKYFGTRRNGVRTLWKGYEGSTITVFHLDGQPYIFGIFNDWLDDDGDKAYIRPIYKNEVTGKVEHGDSVHMRYFGKAQGWGTPGHIAVKSFELNGDPYLFALKDCCSQWLNVCLRHRPGEVYVLRINDDPLTGWEPVTQMEDLKMIRDSALDRPEAAPAISLGDFNVHKSRYGFMDNIFERRGARDAYLRVHGTAAGGQTIDKEANKLDRVFSNTQPGYECDGEMCRDRLDYVYVKECGGGSRLVPKTAEVLDGWTYDDTCHAVSDMDLSDHYPLLLTLETQDVSGEADLAISTEASPTEVGPGGTLTYNVTVSNYGPDDAPCITVTSPFDDSDLFCEWTCSAAGDSSCGRDRGMGDIHETIEVAAGDDVTFTATCRVDCGAVTPVIYQTSRVTAPDGINDVFSPNNTDGVETPVYRGMQA